MPIDIALYQPEIPPNTGSVMRLCANGGFRLHLIEPLGFELDDRRLRRAGLDYRDRAVVTTHSSLEACVTSIAPSAVLAVSTRGSTHYTDWAFESGHMLLFGPETRGLPTDLLATFPAAQVLRIPMLEDSRSLNLANAVSVVAYEAWRQLGFCGATTPTA